MLQTGGLKMEVKKSVGLVLFLVGTTFCAESKKRTYRQSRTKEVALQKPLRPMENITPEKMNGFLKKFFVDSYHIGQKVFTLESMKVLSAVVPFYLIGRKADPVVHRQFYDAENHKNKHQPPHWLKELLADEAMAIPFAIYGLTGWFHTDPVRRRAAQLFGTGLLWTWSTKILVKEIKTEAGLRPWHEEFSQHKRSHGGNPSGHTSMAMFMATYLGLMYGWKAGVPLGMYTAAVAGLSVAVNHHYISQVFAGAGLGAVIGVATYSVFQDWQLPENLEVALATDSRGNLGMKIAYNF